MSEQVAAHGKELQPYTYCCVCQNRSLAFVSLAMQQSKKWMSLRRVEKQKQGVKNIYQKFSFH